MAITRLWQSGAETGSIYEYDNVSSNFGVTTSDKYTDTYSFYNTSTAWPGWGTVNIPATRQTRSGFFWKGNTSLLGYSDIFTINSSGAELVGLRIYGVGDNYKMELRIGGSVQDTEANVVVLAWRHFGIDVKIHSSTGWIKVYQGGIEILSFTGNTGDSDIATEEIGISLTSINAPYTHYIDDVYIDDTTGEGTAAVCPILIFPYIAPNGAGNYTQWDPSAGSNWDCVEEVPPSDSDYVDTTVVDEYDSYTMTTYTLGTGETIEAVIPITRVQRLGTSEQIALGTRYSSTDVIGSDQDPSVGSYSYLSERQLTKPGGGAWDQASLDGVEAVIKSRGSF